MTNLSEIISEWSWDEILSTLPDAFLSVLYLVIAIAIYAVLIWHFYRFIARRDCFKISSTRYPKVVGFLKYFLLVFCCPVQEFFQYLLLPFHCVLAGVSAFPGAACEPGAGMSCAG